MTQATKQPCDLTGDETCGESIWLEAFGSFFHEKFSNYGYSTMFVHLCVTQNEEGAML